MRFKHVVSNPRNEVVEKTTHRCNKVEALYVKKECCARDACNWKKIQLTGGAVMYIVGYCAM